MSKTAHPFGLQAFQYFYQASSNDRGVYCYHAHTYFPLTTEGRMSADKFKNVWQTEFRGCEGVVFGETMDFLAGPHTRGNFETAFTRDFYGEVVMWLQQHRPLDLSILIHPFTTETVKDHTVCAAWLGEPLPCTLDPLRRADAHYAKRLTAGETEADLCWEAVCELNPHVKSAATKDV